MSSSTNLTERQDRDPDRQDNQRTRNGNRGWRLSLRRKKDVNYNLEIDYNLESSDSEVKDQPAQLSEDQSPQPNRPSLVRKIQVSACLSLLTAISRFAS